MLLTRRSSIVDFGLWSTAKVTAALARSYARVVWMVRNRTWLIQETLLPLLLLPVVAPVLLAATRASEAALGGSPGDGWPWVRLLAVFAVVYVAFGVVAFGPLLEES